MSISDLLSTNKLIKSNFKYALDRLRVYRAGFWRQFFPYLCVGIPESVIDRGFELTKEKRTDYSMCEELTKTFRRATFQDEIFRLLTI